MDLEETLSVLDKLSRSGLFEIGEVGKKINHSLRKLEQAAVSSAQARSGTCVLRDKFRELVKAHKNYVLFNREIINLNYNTQEIIETLTPRFTRLETFATELYKEVENFAKQHLQIPKNATISNISSTTRHRLQPQIGEAETSTTPHGFQSQIGEAETSTTPHRFQPQVGETETSTTPNTFQVETQYATGSSATTNISQAEITQTVSSFPAVNNNYLANKNIIWEISIPLRINKIHDFQSRVSLFRRLNLEPDFQLQYLKDRNGNNKFFMGINCNLSLNVSNLKNSPYEKSRLVSVKTFNTLGKIYRTHNHSGFTLSLGHIMVVKQKEIVVSANFPFISIKFQKENVSFELECSNIPNIITSKNQFYSSFKPLISCEFFPFFNILPSNSAGFPKRITDTLNTPGLSYYQPGNESSNFQLATISADNSFLEQNDSWNDSWLNDNFTKRSCVSAETSDSCQSAIKAETQQQFVAEPVPNGEIQTPAISSRPFLANAFFFLAVGITISVISKIPTWIRNRKLGKLDNY